MKDNFLKYLRTQVKHFRDQYSLSEGKAFGMWYAIEGLGLEEDEAFEAVSYDGGNDKGIDLFYVDQESERVIIGQLKFNSNGTYKGKKNELLALIHTTDWLKDPESLDRDGRKDLGSAGREYLSSIDKGYSIEYVYVYCGPYHKDVDDTSRQFNVSEAGNVPSRSCRIANHDILSSEHSERVGQSTRIDNCELKIDQKNSFEEKGGFGTAFVTTVTGDQVRQLYETYGNRLFDRNVRLFLGARKGGVNAAIRTTIDTDSDRPNFWAYNNGLTFVCDSYNLHDGNLVLDNFSIVNGCQTAVSIANSIPSTAKKIRVLARFIAVPERTIDSVIRYTNSQNPIRLWDLTAQDKLQKKLKRELATLPQPYMYILRKGENRQLTQKEKSRFRRAGTSTICTIRHDLAAQYLASFRGFPSIAYKDKGRVFSSYYERVFPAQIRAEELVLVWQAGSATTALVKNELEKAVQNNDQSRISILKRGAKFFVLSAMAIVLHERNGKTFLNTIKPDVVVSKKTEDRLKNYAGIALEWYVESMEELIGMGTEVSTIVRSTEWWIKIRKKIESKWKVYSLAKNVVRDSLPVL